jgi:hypothetical protein
LGPVFGLLAWACALILLPAGGFAQSADPEKLAEKPPMNAPPRLDVSFRQSLPPASALPERKGLPDPFLMFDGSPVMTRDDWFSKRRPELKLLFQHYVYGYMPSPPKNLRATVDDVDPHALGGRATRKLITIRFGPEAAPPISLLLVVPNGRTQPAPVWVGLNFCGNHAVLDDPKIPLPTAWMRDSCQGVEKNRATEAGRGTQVDVWAIENTIQRGYAVATAYYGDIDPDRDDFTDGVHPHFATPPQTRPGPNEWGAIAAWAWGVHRIVDALLLEPAVDRKRICVTGHSRLGKTALLAAALDERIALAIPHQAGCGGTAPSRGTVGESVKQINDRFPHWFNAEFKKFNSQVERLPFDQHCLVALVAPRPVLFSNAVEDTWANPEGQFQVLRAADPVYRFLGAGGLEAEKMPETGKLIDSTLGSWIRPGKHSMTRADWDVFCDFADKHFGKQKPGPK